MSFGAGRHGKINALGFEQLRVACQQLHTLHGGGHAPARDHAEVLRRRQLCAQVLFAAPHDGLACVGRLHQPDHPLDGAILAHLGGPHLKGTKLVHRAAGHLVAHGLVHGQAFAGHDGLIDGGLPGRDDAVHGHRLARQHPQHVAHLHLLSRNDRLGAVFQHAGRLRGQVHQLFNVGTGFGHGQFFQQARGHAFGCGVLPL